MVVICTDPGTQLQVVFMRCNLVDMFIYNLQRRKISTRNRNVCFSNFLSRPNLLFADVGNEFDEPAAYPTALRRHAFSRTPDRV